MIIKKIIKNLRKSYRNFIRIDEIVKSEVRKEKTWEQALFSKEVGVTDKISGKNPVIVSLTSYGKKVQQVHLAIESLMHQTIKPNKIVLCLAEEFENNLPVMVEQQRGRGLEIIFCKDIRSYTKLIPTLRKYPQSVIVTVDDDIIYPIDFLEYLVKAYQNNPTKIYFYYGHTIKMDKNCNFENYTRWTKTPAKGSSLYNLPTGVDGILYPPGCFHQDIYREDVFMELCPYADDLWFKCMSLLKGIECECVERVEDVKREFVHLDAADDSALSTMNNDKNMNDVQFDRLNRRYNLQKYLDNR